MELISVPCFDCKRKQDLQKLQQQLIQAWMCKTLNPRILHQKHLKNQCASRHGLPGLARLALAASSSFAKKLVATTCNAVAVPASALGVVLQMAQVAWDAYAAQACVEVAFVCGCRSLASSMQPPPDREHMFMVRGLYSFPTYPVELPHKALQILSS